MNIVLYIGEGLGFGTMKMLSDTYIFSIAAFIDDA